MPEPIRIVADVPTPKPGLGFADYVDALVGVIMGGLPARFTVGLYGAWGSGKSSLLAGVAESLKDEDVLVVEFDAWRHERADHIVVPLLDAVRRAAAAHPSFKSMAQQLGRLVKATVSSITATAKLGLVDLEVSGADFVSTLEEPTVGALDTAFAKPMAELAKIPPLLKWRRIVVLVDDLDRCSPKRVVDLLEAINQVMDVEGFVFVLALDYDVLVTAVQAKYQHLPSGHAFIEKLVQIPFRVPPFQISSGTHMRELVPNWIGFMAQHDPTLELTVAGVSQLALGGNPRQVKRLINYVLVLERIIERRQLSIPRELVVAVVALQLAWPDLYQKLVERHAAGESDVLLDLSRHSDAIVVRFHDQYLASLADRDLRESALGLTGTVVATPVAKPTAGEDDRATFERWLASQRFRLVEREIGDVNVWVTSAASGLALRCGPSEIRFAAPAEVDVPAELLKAQPYSNDRATYQVNELMKLKRRFQRDGE